MASCRTPMSLIGETATYTSGSHSGTWRLVFIVQLKTSFLLGGGSRHKQLHLWLRRSLLEWGSTLTGFTFMPAIRGRRDTRDSRRRRRWSDYEFREHTSTWNVSAPQLQSDMLVVRLCHDRTGTETPSATDRSIWRIEADCFCSGRRRSPVGTEIQVAWLRARRLVGAGTSQWLVGDARSLLWEAGRATAALFMGPLYHLRGVGAAAAALVPPPKEHGALIPGHILVAKSTSRLVKLLNGIRLGLIDDRLRRSSATTADSATAFFRSLAELTAEIRESGFR